MVNMEEEHFESLYPDSARQYEIEKLLAFVKEGNSCQLIGLPGAGRSDLLELLAYNKKVKERHLGTDKHQMLFVMVDFSEIRKRPLVDVMKFLFLSLADALRDQKMTEEYRLINESFREALSFHDELVLFQELKQVVDFLAIQKKLTLVFLFDRFEEYVPSVTGEFFTNLRILRNRAKYKFSVIFSIDRPLEVLLDPLLLSDFYEFVAGHTVYIRLCDEASNNFVLSYLEGLTRKELGKAVYGEISFLTGGHAKLARLGIEAFLANGERKVGAANFLLAQKPVQAALAEIWLSLTPAEQSDILHNSFEDMAVDRYLEETGLIKDKNIQIPMFAKWVESSKALVKQAEEKIIYDENTDSIRKGQTILSDNLTSAEFRMLSYLLQNQGRVINRDEIISIVWEGVKSTAGITDQAVDQLIFRLRKKIEGDPNKPQYLQTVKGRGFKFVG